MRLVVWVAGLAIQVYLGAFFPVFGKVVEDISFQVVADHIKVNYNLSVEGTYGVELWLIAPGEQGFSLQASAVRGDVGAKVEAGFGKEIIWQVLVDLPKGIDREEVFFEIRVRRQRSKRWLWWGLGSGALGTAVLALLPREKPKGTIEIDVPEPPE